MPYVYRDTDETPGAAYSEGYNEGWDDGWEAALAWAGIKVEG